MRIGITYDLKSDTSPRPDQPDDFQEEFDSPVTIEAIAAVLRAAGHEVIKLGDGRGLLERLLADPPDFVFNLAEGEGIGRSREARVPAVLFLSEDNFQVGWYGDRTLAKYRKVVAEEFGAACPTGLVPEPEALLAAVTQDWLNEFERIQLILRTSARLRKLHND